MRRYMHGYSQREAERLHDQSSILRLLLHTGVTYPAGSRVLEAGCGVGAQTVSLATNSPAAEFVSIDISALSLERAQALIEGENITSVRFHRADILAMPFGDCSFDHVFVCFVLEHLSEPPRALAEMRRVLKVGGTLTAIEGDHGSCFWHPETDESRKAWQAMIRVQQNLGHDPLIGRRLYPLLANAGFYVKNIVPLSAYADARDPGLLDGGINKILAPMMETAREDAIGQEIIDGEVWDKGVNDLRLAAAAPDGSVFYSWFKAVGLKGY